MFSTRNKKNYHTVIGDYFLSSTLAMTSHKNALLRQFYEETQHMFLGRFKKLSQNKHGYPSLSAAL